MDRKYATREFVAYLRKATGNFDETVVEALLWELRGGELRQLVIDAPYVMEHRERVIETLEIHYYKSRPNPFEGRGGAKA